MKLEEKYLNEKAAKFDDMVKTIFLTKLKSHDPKEAKKMTMDLVAKEAEKYINIILHKALKK
jgi:capsule polysaccharide export protein KpsE/RkpR